MTKNSHVIHRHYSDNDTAKRISMSLPPKLLFEFERAMKKSGFSDRSKAIQTALHGFIDQNDWDSGDDTRNGAGVIMMLYNSHTYPDSSGGGTHIQHNYSDIISATTHLHLDHDNCLETVLVRGEIRKIKMLTRSLSESRGIKSLKVYFVSIV